LPLAGTQNAHHRPTLVAVQRDQAGCGFASRVT
jgi:hypothetical protein